VIKTSDINGTLFWITHFQIYFFDNRNITPLKYRFRLSIFQISYSIAYIDYRLSHSFSEHKLSNLAYLLNVCDILDRLLWRHKALSVLWVFRQASHVRVALEIVEKWLVIERIHAAREAALGVGEFARRQARKGLSAGGV
jgi:hypothetical protein